MRRSLGVAVLLGVAGIALGLDRGALTRFSLATTGGIEQRLIDGVGPANEQGRAVRNGVTVSTTPGDRRPNALAGLTSTVWINSPPLTGESLKGKIVVVDFWTYSCINCLRTLPYLKAWWNKYNRSGLLIIGVHTPEFPFEKDEASVRRVVRDLGILYPVTLDNDYKIWRSFQNEYWPAHYFIDTAGHVRYQYFGEGDYDQSETWIRDLLKEANVKNIPDSPTDVSAAGVELPPSGGDHRSPETYVGYDRAEHFASPGDLYRDEVRVYRLPSRLKVNEWALSGTWNVEAQLATLVSSSGQIAYRFHARDLHLVLGPASTGNPVRFRVTIDGKAPGPDHGVDTDANGDGVITEHRLYQLIRERPNTQNHEFRIEFLDSGAQAYAFTFG